MFNKKFKLLVTMVGLVAVLVGLMAMPGVTQGGFPCPASTGKPWIPCIDRSQLVQGLQNQFAGLTASTEDLLDFEQAVFWSDGIPRLPIAFKMRLRANKDYAEVVFINAEGEEVMAFPATLDLTSSWPSCGGSRPKFSIEILDFGECPHARSRSDATALKGCGKITVCCLVRPNFTGSKWSFPESGARLQSCLM